MTPDRRRPVELFGPLSPGDPTFADAILDRIVHNAYRLELQGESMRKLQAQKTAGAALDQDKGK